MRISNLQQYITYCILLICSIWVFFCFNESSMAVECLALFIVLFILNLRSDVFRDIVWFLIIALFFSFALLISGRLMERGDYNIPWKFLVKFYHILFASICGSLMKHLNLKMKRRVVIFALVSIIFSALVSLYYVIRVNPLAIRYRHLVGITQTFSFDQIFALPILAPVLVLFFWSYKKSIKHRFVFVVSTIIIFLCVFLSVLTTSILIALIGLVLVFLFISFEKGNKSSVIMALVMLFLGIVFLFFRSQIGEIIYKLTSNMSTVVQQRLSRVIDLLFATEHENTYSMDRRFELANYSLETFKSHPVFGVGIGKISYGVIGYHQEWPDVLGVCGILGSAFIFFAFFDYFKRRINEINNRVDKMGTIIGLILMFVLGCLDPCLVIPELYLVMVILPNMSVLVLNGKEGLN